MRIQQQSVLTRKLTLLLVEAGQADLLRPLPAHIVLRWHSSCPSHQTIAPAKSSAPHCHTYSSTIYCLLLKTSTSSLFLSLCQPSLPVFPTSSTYTISPTSFSHSYTIPVPCLSIELPRKAPLVPGQAHTWAMKHSRRDSMAKKQEHWVLDSHLV